MTARRAIRLWWPHVLAELQRLSSEAGNVSALTTEVDRAVLVLGSRRLSVVIHDRATSVSNGICPPEHYFEVIVDTESPTHLVWLRRRATFALDRWPRRNHEVDIIELVGAAVHSLRQSELP